MAVDRRDDPAVRRLRPLSDFLHTEAAGGVALVVAAVVAIVWANSPWRDTYQELWSTTLVIELGGHAIDLSLRDWVNDGLMVVFFFVVGLEVKRELVEGELREPRRAALPAIAAVGGMLTPALIFLAFNAGGEGVDGWGIPVATDIAMAVGVLSLLGARVAPSLKLFLLTLAIVDDIGAIAIIAVFYADDVDGWSAVAAVGVLAAIVACRAIGVRSIGAYVVLGVALWIAVHESGIHATIAGVALGLLTPTRPFRRADLVDADELPDLSAAESARRTANAARSSVSVVEWLEHVLHPWTSFVIVPVFALANAGIVVSTAAVEEAVRSPIAHGIVAGLVVGKLVGVTTFTWLAVRLRIGELPPGASWLSIVGIGALAGIGFTVSIFVTGLAFADQPLVQDEAKLAILTASTIAAILGTLVLVRRPGKL